jgi:hypothetical protein
VLKIKKSIYSCHKVRGIGAARALVEGIEAKAMALLGERIRAVIAVCKR